MRRAALASLALALALGGCALTDCEFATSESRTVGGVVLADGGAVGDTLTIAFVRTASVPLEVTIPPGLGDAPDPSPDTAVELLYDAVGQSVSGGRLPQPLAAQTRGDTVYVYVLGTLDPARFACSPPEAGVRVQVRDLLVPAGVAAARLVVIDAEALPEPAAAALRQSEAARRAAQPITA